MKLKVKHNNHFVNVEFVLNWDVDFPLVEDENNEYFSVGSGEYNRKEKYFYHSYDRYVSTPAVEFGYLNRWKAFFIGIGTTNERCTIYCANGITKELALEELLNEAKIYDIC